MILGLSILLAAALATGASTQSATAVPVRISGSTGASSELQRDVLQTIAYFGPSLGCPAPSKAVVGGLNASMISPNASFYSPALGSAYEEWVVTFCGKSHRFLVTFAPDPKGGSFLSVVFPYPADAPTATFR